ncbi:MAG: energy transducer TonB [Myxococcales bacterium]|nr:energy transducer TonB [Myxococcales bacterium]
MTSTKDQHRCSKQGRATAIMVVASLVVHGAVFVTASVAFDADDLSGGLGDAVTSERVGAKVEFSCWIDATLALAAREVSCTVPGLGKAACSEAALRDFRFDWLLCDGLQDVPVSDALALLSPADIAALEPLLDVPEKDELELAELLEEELEEKALQSEQAASSPRESGQVIEITAPDLETTPDKARFLSEFDSHTDRETVVRGSTEKMVVKPSAKELPIADESSELLEEAEPSRDEALEEVAAATAESEAAAEGGGDAQAEAAVMAMRELQFRARSEAGENSGVDALAANGLAARKGDGAQDVTGQREREAQEASRGGVATKSGVPNLRPTQDTITRVVGGGSVDKLDGVESGDFTSLNTKKWKFASFFNRMKRQVAQSWHPDTVYARRDPTGEVYGTKNRITVLEVSLQPGGKLAKVIVLEESGVEFLDSEAIAAFERAQPFPNPPTGLIAGGSGLITFSFGFHFQVGAPRGGWKIFRQR